MNVSAEGNSERIVLHVDPFLLDDYKKPLIYFVETNPWLMVIGSDVPSFALYESGLVIYRVIEDRNIIYYSARLSPVELQGLIDDLISSDEIYSLEEDIFSGYAVDQEGNLLVGKDQPENMLVINLEQAKTIAVYGSLSNDVPRDYTPDVFVEIYDKITNYRNDAAKEWEAPFLEVMLWNYDHARRTRKWPEHFPDLNSPLAVRRGDSYSLFIERNQQQEFFDFYDSMRGNRAVNINEWKMALSYRIPFPNINFEINTTSNILPENYFESLKAEEEALKEENNKTGFDVIFGFYDIISGNAAEREKEEQEENERWNLANPTKLPR
jgi:hypothetical protein